MARQDVESDEVGERERSHRMVHAELHYAVDRLGRGHAFVQREDRLVDHRHQHTVRDEAGIVVHLDRRLPHRLRELLDALIRVIARGDAPNHFDERHHRHRVHEMHTDDFVRPFRGRADLRDGDRGGVRGEDAVGRCDLVELREELRLGAEALDDRFDDEIGAGGRGDVGGRPDAAERGLLFIRAHPPFVDAALEVGGDRIDGLADELIADIDELDVEP